MLHLNKSTTDNGSPIGEVFTASRGMSRRGFTIIELIVYIGLLGVVLSSVVVILYQVIAGQTQSRNRSEVDGEANFLMQKITEAMNGVQTINQPAAGATSSILSVSRYNYAQNPIVFELASGTVTISRGGGSAVPLNDSYVAVTQLVFNHIPAAGGMPEGVSTTISLVSSAGGRLTAASTTVSEVFYLLQ
jgi:type II secretory pathway pseudopilin PulG